MRAKPVETGVILQRLKLLRQRRYTEYNRLRESAQLVFETGIRDDVIHFEQLFVDELLDLPLQYGC